MSVNKFISKICNLPVPLKKKDVPSPIMLKKVFSHMHSRIVESKTGSFRFKEDETQVLLLALEKAMEHGYLQDLTPQRLATLAELATRILIFHLPPIDLSVSRRLPAFTENGAGLKFTVHYLIARSTW